MTTIADLINFDQIPNNQPVSNALCLHSLVGIEVELEEVTKKVPDYVRQWWAVVEDHSLRNNGLEFKSGMPYAGLNLVKSLEALNTFCATFKPGIGERTSTHVHINVLDMTPEQLFKMILVYAIFEQALFRVCGEERVNNIFCGSIMHCEGNVEILGALGTLTAEGLHKSLAVGQEGGKYSSLNVQTITRFGTVEFRGHKGCFDKDEILKWVNLLLHLKKFATEYQGSPTEIVEYISRFSARELASSVFEMDVPLVISDNLDEEILEGARLAQDILHFYSLEKMKMQNIRRTKDKSKDRFRAAIEKHQGKNVLNDYDNHMGYV